MTMAISESRKKKLQMLLRSISRGDLAEAQDILRKEERPGCLNGRGAHISREPIALEDACPGIEQTISTHSGSVNYWGVRRSLSEIAPDTLGLARQYANVMRGAHQRLDELEASPALCHLANLSPEDLLFMDTETCGFSGTVVFLIGLMFYEQDEFVFEQLLARNYAEEAGILQGFAERLGRAAALVSFNGKAFDMNMIRERSAFHTVALPESEPPHLDLLHESRRRWKSLVPNCRLQTLEAFICGRRRAGDIPGHDIPDAYHEFVRTGDARRIKEIHHHNLLDLLTMAELLCAILTGRDPSIK